MGIDLSALDRLAFAGDTKRQTEGDYTPSTENAAQGKETPNAGRHYTRLEAEREQARRYSAICREYQENICHGSGNRARRAATYRAGN